MSGFLINLASSFDPELGLTFDPELPPPPTREELAATSEVIHALVARLPTVAATGVCTICLEEFEWCEAGAKQLPCNHRFHGECIVKWLSEYNSCPLCRSCVCGPSKDVMEK